LRHSFIEADHHAARPFVSQQFDQHRRETVHRVGDLSRRRNQSVRQREKRAERQRMTVEQQYFVRIGLC
jgi:hypothetical protein